MKVRVNVPTNSFIIMNVQFRKHVFVQMDFERRVLKNEEKSLRPSEQNFTDQVVADSQFQSTQ